MFKRVIYRGRIIRNPKVKKSKSQKIKKKKKDSRFAEVHLKKLFELNDLGCTDRSKIKDSESLPSSLS